MLPQLEETPEPHANGGDCDEAGDDKGDDQNDGVDGVADGDSSCSTVVNAIKVDRGTSSVALLREQD